MTTATPLTADYNLALSVAGLLGALLPRVYVGTGVGTDWEQTPIYPYAVVAPGESEITRGGTSRTVNVRIVARADDYAAKPAPLAGDVAGRVLVVGAVARLAGIVACATDAIVGARNLGAVVESISTSYPADPGAPVEAATIDITFADVQAFADSL